ARAEAPAPGLGDGKRHIAHAEQAARKATHEGLVADQHDGIARLRQRLLEHLAISLEAGVGLEQPLDERIRRQGGGSLPGAWRRAAQYPQGRRQARRQPARDTSGLRAAPGAERASQIGVPARLGVAGIGMAPDHDLLTHGWLTSASRARRRYFCIRVSRDSVWSGSAGMQSTGQNTRHCGSSKWPTHSVQRAGSISYISGPMVIAWFGQAG